MQQQNIAIIDILNDGVPSQKQINMLRSCHGISQQFHGPKDCCLDVRTNDFFANAVAKAITPSMRCFKVLLGKSNVSTLDLPQRKDKIDRRGVNHINHRHPRSLCNMDTMQDYKKTGVVGCGSNPFWDWWVGQ